MIEFFVHMTPAAQGRPRTATRDRRGRVLARPVTYTPAASRTARTVIQWAAVQVRPENLIKGPVNLVVVACRRRPSSWPKKRWAWDTKEDWDNLGKIVSDALNGIVYQDDAQVVQAHVFKIVSETHEGFLVRVSEAESAYSSLPFFGEGSAEAAIEATIRRQNR